jgi:hypothetical protein
MNEETELHHRRVGGRWDGGRLLSQYGALY